MDNLTEYEKHVQDIKKLLDANRENWETKWEKYADGILSNINKIEGFKEKFHEWKPLYLYMNVGDAYNEGKGNQFNLRFKGNSVADIKFDKDNEPLLSTKKEQKDTNAKKFEHNTPIQNVYWNSDEAKQFRNFFKKYKTTEKADEHEIESATLTEMEDTTKDKFGGTFKNIKPIKIANICRFQMTTPLSASKLPVTYNEIQNGGGIDILARAGNGPKLTIIELKINCDKIEDAIKQSLTYATFIRELLKSDKTKDKWWKIFGYTRELPEKLSLNAVYMMPCKSDSEKITGTINLDNDEIQIQYIYYQENENGNIIINETSMKECQK